MMAGWVALAFADEDPRQSLVDALLRETLDGPTPAVIAVYDDLSKRLASDDPLRGDVLYWLGHARWLAGDIEAARAPILEGIRTGSCPTRCRDLLERLELEVEAVRGLPVRWTFDDNLHGVFHPWRFQDRGSIRLAEGGALAWTTSPDPRQPDRLVLAIDVEAPVNQVAVDLLATTADVTLQLVVTDTRGDRFGLRDAWRVPAHRAARLAVDASDFVPLDGDRPLSPTAFAELWLVDITPQGTPQGTLAPGDTVRIDIDAISLR